MANAVAVLIHEYQAPIPMTCADGAGIPKGTLLALTDPLTVAATSGANDKFGGIAAEEKISGDGKTKIAVYRKGVFRVESGTNGTTVGLPQVIDDGANEVTDLAANDSDLGYVFGTALETATNGETFLMELGTQ
jgi:hypothetical protein